MDTNLLPISQIVKKTGADKIHLAYLTKLRLLPQTIRRKIAGRIEGCYPDSVVSRLEKIETLKNAGLTYSQIRFELAQETAHPQANNLLPLAYLFIGLVLGFLLAPRAASSPLSPQDIETQTMVTISKLGVPLVQEDNQSNEPIYIVTNPAQNFYRVGTVSINDLVKN